MASNKDVLEAQRFNRRRLVTAFSSGTPGGREIESSSGLAPLLVGGVVALGMVGAALVMGRFSPTLPEGWENSTTVVVASTGARYYTIDGALRPVANITSAKLLSESGSYRTSRVSASTISGIPRGSRIGLEEAPDDVPTASALASGEWTACAAESGTRAWVARTPEGLVDAPAALVVNAGVLDLVVGGTRHRIDDTTNSGVLLALGLDSATPVEVDAAWLDLFERGSDLVAVELPEAGAPVSGMPAALSTAVVGTIVEVESEDGAARREYIVTGDGRISPLTSTASRLYRISDSGALAGNPLKAKVADLASLEIDPQGVGASDWPDEVGAVIGPDDAPCASLVLGEEGAGSRLMAMPGGIDEDGAGPVEVAGGSGALVKATAGGDLGAVLFVSDDGLRHGLGVDPTDSLARLGWRPEDVVAVPAAWTALVPEGIALTSDAAWATVAVR